MKIYCRPKPQAVEIRELDSHDCLLDSRLGRQGYVNKTRMTAAPAAENPTLKRAVALDGVTRIYGRRLQITSAIYSGGVP